MWYVIQVMGGQEEKTAGMIRSRVSEAAMEECFIPKKERVKKFKGSWKRVEEILFPGYVFAEANEPEMLYRELKQITMMTKLLQDGTFCFLPLSKAEEMMIKRIGNNYHITGLSKIRVENQGNASGGSKNHPSGGSKNHSGGGSKDHSGGGSKDHSGGGSKDHSGGGSKDHSSGENNDNSSGKCDRRVVIIDGPLKEQEGLIVKYNLHKREATVRILFMGREVDLKLGIEMVEEKE